MAIDKLVKILDMQDPVINGTTNYSHLLSILACEKKTEEWIYSNFIHVYANDDLIERPWGDFYNPYPYEVRLTQVCPCISAYRIPRDTIGSTKEEILEFVNATIARGYYIHTFIEHKCIKSFQTNGHYHDALIFGIDNEKELVYVADVFQKGVYERKQLNFDEFVDSVVQCKITKTEDYLWGGTLLYGLKQEYDYEFNIQNIITFIKMYYECTIPEYWRVFNNSDSVHFVYGIGVYKAFQKMMRDVIERNIPSVMMSHFQFLKDHKIAMHMRLKYMCDKGYYDRHDLQTFIELYEKLENMCDIVIFSTLKSSMGKREYYLNKVLNTLVKMEEMEKDGIKKMIKVLEENKIS